MDSDTDWIKFGTGMVLLKKGNKGEAEEIFQSLVIDHPLFGYPYEQLGLLRKDDGKIGEAHQWFMKAIDRMPNDEMGLYHRGRLQMDLKRYDDAADSFTKVVELNPSHTETMILMAIAHGYQNKFEAAFRLINDAYAKDDSLCDGFVRLSYLKSDTAEWEAALNLVKLDINHDRISPSGKIYAATLFGRMGNFERAKTFVYKAYDEDANLRDGFASLCAIQAESLKRGAEDPLEFINLDRQLNRLSTNQKLISSKYYLWAQRFKDAESLVDEAYKEDKEVREGYSRLATGSLIMGDKIKALEYWKKDRMLKRDTERSQVRYDFICREEWTMNEGPLYIYKFFDDPEMSAIESPLEELNNQSTSQVMLEVSIEDRKWIEKKFPNWKISENMIFSGGNAQLIPAHYKILSYKQLCQLFSEFLFSADSQ